MKLIQEKCAAMNVHAVVANGFAKGGDGMTELAEEVVKEIEGGKQ